MRFNESALRTPGFNWQNMLSLALASKYSYKNKANLKRIIASGWDVGISAAVNIADTQGYLLESDSVAVLVYRGTESIGDWLINFDVFDENGNFGEVHSGFRGAFESSKHIMVPKLQAASSAGKTIWLTGHSLGGAVALNAAIETFGTINLAGVATFGQPRIARSATARNINASLGASYFRFVNDDDVVSRVPITYSHAGQLFQFNSYGDLEQSAAESELEEELELGRPPLEDWELEKLRSTINEIKEEVSGSGTIEGDFGGFLTESLEGLLPSVSDHMIDRYIEALSQHVPRANSSNMEAESILAISGISNDLVAELTTTSDPFLQEFDASSDEVIGYESTGPELITRDIFPRSFEGLPESIAVGGAPATQIREDTLIPLLIEVSRSWEPPEGLKVSSRFQNIATVLATQEQLKELGNNSDEVSFLELSRDAGIVELEDSVPFINGNNIHAPNLDERGDAAIVGVIDTGIDILHNAFMDDTTTGTRILGIWDQRDNTGPSPKDLDPDNFSQDYGTLHIKAGLQEAIQKHRDRIRPVPSRLRDPGKHGTHVASIAAGKATGKLASGMASGAHILFVIPNMKQEMGSPPSIGYSNSHVDALYFLTVAAAGNNTLIENRMPIAINVSLGMNAGAHDGSTLLESAFDSVTNGGRDRGVVIVKSAGNERSHAGHASIQAVHGGVVELAWESKEKRRQEDYLEGWFESIDDLAFVVVDPNNNRSAEVSLDNKKTTDVLNGNICTMTLSEVYRDNAANRLTIRIVPQSKRIQDGRWRLEIIGRNIETETGMVNLWVERNDERAVTFEVEDVRMTLSVPGTAKTVVTVGATNTETPWRLNSSSSFGPTRTGDEKPDICAPGFQISAALAGRNDHDATIAWSGTSMAAPHVTGAIALALSKIAKTPTLDMPNAKQVAMRLRHTVTGGIRLHHPGAGYGLMDAEAFYRKITGL